jgi:hypothetical protein
MTPAGFLLRGTHQRKSTATVPHTHFGGEKYTPYTRLVTLGPLDIVGPRRTGDRKPSIVA